MLKHSILLFLGFLALASAAFTPEKNFFFLPSDSNLSTQLFQTRHGTIAYSVVLMESGQYYPSYVQINQETNNVTEIMQELTADCGQGASAFDRFQYHVLTYSFVYYCTNNNSILILDAANNFSVQQAFSLSINQTFDEVRLTTDGYNIVIVGMSGLFTQNPGPSHLIKLSLQTQQIVNHVVFNHDLAAGEFVTAYGTNGNMFIITNIINSTTNIANVYAMTLIGNSYSLTRLSTFNSTSSFPYTLPEFYVNKNLIFASSEDSLVILDQNGNIQKVQEGVALNQFTMSATETLYRPAIVSYPGSGSVFVSLQNWTLLEFSLQNQGFNIQDRGVTRSVSLAIQDQLTDTLFYSFGGQDDDFKMTNVDHSNVVYQSVSSFTNFMITDKTYCALTKLNYLEIFDLQTNDLIQEIQVSNSSYYDQKSSTFSFLYVNDSQVIFQQIDLTTGNNYTLPLSFTGADSAQLVHATNNERFDSPEITFRIPGSSDKYLIISQTFGQVNFVLDAPISPFNSTLAVDYDTLTVFYFLNSKESPSIVSVTEYNYVSSNKSFVSVNTNQVTISADIDFIIPAIDYSVIGTPNQIGVIDMSSSSMNPTEYTISSQWTYPSTFQNSSNGFNMVLSQAQQWGAQSETESAGILHENQIEDLPGTTYTTVQAGTAGSCSYWVVNQVGSFGVVQFYNICDNDAVFEIIA